jgi:hypothetical protein
LGTIKKGLFEVRGYEGVANLIDVMTDDQHCNSCALGKAKMPATPKGKTVRPSRKVVNTKMYVDLSVRTLLIVCVSHQARIRVSNIIRIYEGLLVTKEKEKILKLTNKFILAFR